MADWKDLYHLMSQGKSAYEIARALNVKLTRLARMMRSKRLAKMLELDERLAVQAAGVMAANAVRNLALQGIAPGDFDRIVPTVPNGSLCVEIPPRDAASRRETAAHAGE